MPGKKGRSGGRRISSRPDAKRAGRKKVFATVRIPIDNARAVLPILEEIRQSLEHGTDAEVGMAFLIAGLWSEVAS